MGYQVTAHPISVGPESDGEVVTVTVFGDPVFYGETRAASDGTIQSGYSLTISDDKFFVTAGTARLEVQRSQPNGSSILFSQAVATSGASATYRVPRRQTLTRATLSCTTAPSSTALNVQVLLNGVAVASLNVLAGSTADTTVDLGIGVHTGDRIAANTVVASGALGVLLQVDVGS